MASGSCYNTILLAVLVSCVLHVVMGGCKDDGESCDQCYQTLESHLINTGDNKYLLRKAFFPPERTPAVFVTVTYQYGNMSTQTWFWSVGSFYFYQPLRVFQFTSLFFGNPDFRRSEAHISLPEECVNASNEFMQTLTQMLKLYAQQPIPNPKIDGTYQGEAISLSTLRSGAKRGFSTDQVFDIKIPPLLFCFQVFFPALTVVIFVLYSLFSFEEIQEYISECVENSSGWGTIVAYALLSCSFVVYVNILDFIALNFRNDPRNDATVEYFIEEYNAELFHYPGVTLLYEFLADVILSVVLIATCCLEKNKKLYALAAAGFAPLLCLASHTHYIAIAWITDPTYAGAIGLYYGAIISMQFIVLQRIYPALDSLLNRHCKVVSRLGFCAVYVIVMLLMFAFVFCYQILIIVTFIVIPIKSSIENTPTRLYTFLQGITALFAGLIAYKVIYSPKEKKTIFPLS